MSKQVFNTEIIYNCAKAIIETKGIEYLTVKSISQKLKSSTQPIYDYFNSLNDIKIKYLSDYSQTFLNSFEKIEPNLIEYSKFILLSSIENPYAFKSVFFSDFKQNNYKTFIIESIRKSIIDLYFDLIRETKILKEKVNDFISIIFSLCSAICNGFLKSNANNSIILIEKFIIPIFE